jgi:hypothetical protein
MGIFKYFSIKAGFFYTDIKRAASNYLNVLIIARLIVNLINNFFTLVGKEVTTKRRNR